MTDLEMTKLCAEAIGYKVVVAAGQMLVTEQPQLMQFGVNSMPKINYNPLHDDAQAMELVKKFEISIAWSWAGQVGCMSKSEARLDENKRHDNIYCTHKDLNRAICECIAIMQLAKA